MTDETTNLVLEHLRHIRARVDAMDGKLDEITTRVGHVERSVAQHAVQLAEMNTRLDGMEIRLSRIERRLELASA